MLFRRGNEYNKLAKAMNSLFIMLNELEYKLNHSPQNGLIEYKEEIFIIGYIARTAIIDRMKVHNWPTANPIIIPYISSSFVTLEFGFNQLFEKLDNISKKMDLSVIMNNILSKRDYYYQIERIIPYHIRDNF